MSGGRSFGTMALHIGSDWFARCDTYPESAPILSVSASGVHLSISIAARREMTDEAVKFARELAADAAMFAAECERLHAEQHGQASDGPATGNSGQAGKAA